MLVPCLAIILVFWTSFAFCYWLVCRNLITPLKLRVARLERKLQQPVKQDYTVRKPQQQAPRSRYRSVEQQFTEELVAEE